MGHMNVLVNNIVLQAVGVWSNKRKGTLMSFL